VGGRLPLGPINWRARRFDPAAEHFERSAELMDRIYRR
jgi:hypothetical protein